MKNTQLITLILVCLFGFSCQKNEETLKLDNFLKTFNLHISDFKVVCIVPMDGCGSCIDPTLKYSKNAEKGFLLVISSLYRKSIENSIERHQLKSINFISDNKNLASEKALVSPTAPCYYFINKGVVIRKIDLSYLRDKESVIQDVKKFLSK
jgi:hypothetical protein